MSDGEQDQLLGFVAGLLLGATIGATAAFLTAPQSGRRTRRKLGRTASDIRRTTEGRWDELAEDVKARVDEAVSGARERMGQG
jgi:gas vesicle protein